MALDRHTETFSLQIISTEAEESEKTQGYTRTNAQRAKLRMTAEGNDELSLRRRVDLLTLELEKAQFKLQTVTEQA
eukprot:119256-Amphidinium_carterae.1